MTTPKIVAVAIAAAEAASGYRLPDAHATTLYAYGRQRKWPAAETLARKFAETAGLAFEWPTLAAAPAPLLVAFETFRAMCVTLEPMFDRLAECPEASSATPLLYSVDEILKETASSSVDELMAMADLGHRLMKTIALATAEGELMEGWTPKESPLEIVVDLVEMNERAHKAALQALETADKALMALKAGDFAPDAAAAPPTPSRPAAEPPLPPEGVEDGSQAGDDKPAFGEASDLPTAEDRLPAGDTPAKAKAKRK